MLLPFRMLVQEQAFERILKLRQTRLALLHADRLDSASVRTRFSRFLRKQKSKHILFLIGEVLLLPLSGLAAILPGPNVFFGILALLTITHWRALKGINRLAKTSVQFKPSSLLGEWEQAVESGSTKEASPLLSRIAEAFGIQHIRKILWR